MYQGFVLQAKLKGIEYRYNCNPNLPTLVESDAKRIRQLVFILLYNALKYTRQGIIKISMKLKEIQDQSFLKI